MNGSRHLTLTKLPVGAAGRICRLDGEANLRARLMEMGFCESSIIEKISGTGGNTLLCQLSGTRIALSEQAGDHIIVEPIHRHAAGRRA
jgi:ferrous iron transport protein A